MQFVENVSIRSANEEREVHYSDIISNNASFADALSNVEPHQHLSCHESISQGILQNKTKQKNRITFLNGISFDNNPGSSSWRVFPQTFCLKLTEMAFNHSELVYLCGPHSLLLLSCKIIQSFLLFMQINSTISLLYTAHWWLEIWGKELTMFCIWPHQSHPDIITVLCGIFHVSIESSNFKLAFSRL